MKLIFLLLAITGPIFAHTKSGTIYTTDGSQADVESAISAATTGDTVSVPAGSFTWGASGDFVLINKAITVSGAGTGATTVTISNTSGTYGSACIRITAAAVLKSFSITGSTLAARTPISVGTADGWRITDIAYTDPSGPSGSGGYFAIVENVYGLFDNCAIGGNNQQTEFILIRGKPNSWTTDHTMGTADAVYIEDCAYSGSGYVCDANSNARVVVRYCTISGSQKVDGHGLASNSPAQGVRHMEVYGNVWSSNATFWTAIELRGGTGMIFNNTNTYATGGSLELTDYAYRNSGGWPNFGGTFRFPSDYPIDDQIGVGKDPKAAASEPMYLWNLRANGALWNRILKTASSQAITANGGVSYGDADLIAADRDFFIENAGTFTGASGVGIGTALQMVAITPVKTGVGFWVTDEGQWNESSIGPDGRLYTWNGSAWALKYTPYTYPHPLRGVLPYDSTYRPKTRAARMRIIK